MNKLICWVILISVAAFGGCGDDDKGFPCGVCSVQSFTCTAGSETGTASLTGPSGSGCSGTLTSSGGTDPLWLHCDRGQICVEHADECFPGSATASSFTYTVPSKGLTVSCTAKTGSSWCDVCSLQNFTCTAGTETATATLGSPDANGCTGTLTATDGVNSLWIHCDTKQICVEHANECFPGTTTANSFSYTIASKSLTVTCTAN